MTFRAVLYQEMLSLVVYKIRVLILIQPTLCTHTYIDGERGGGGKENENGSFRE